MLSGNSQACPYLEKWMPATTIQDNYDHDQTTYDSKTKIVVFYFLSNAFDLISGSQFGEDIYIQIFRNQTGSPPLISVGESILFIHACA